MSDEDIDLKDKVIATFDSQEAVDSAVTELESQGFPTEVIDDQETLERIAPGGSEGLLAGLKDAAATLLSEEDQVMDEAAVQVDEGRSFLIVDVSEGDQKSAAAILRRHGGHYMWHFGQWSYVRLADE